MNHSDLKTKPAAMQDSDTIAALDPSQSPAPVDINRDSLATNLEETHPSDDPTKSEIGAPPEAVTTEGKSVDEPDNGELSDTSESSSPPTISWKPRGPFNSTISSGRPIGGPRGTNSGTHGQNGSAR